MATRGHARLADVCACWFGCACMFNTVVSCLCACWPECSPLSHVARQRPKKTVCFCSLKPVCLRSMHSVVRFGGMSVHGIEGVEPTVREEAEEFGICSILHPSSSSQRPTPLHEVAQEWVSNVSATFSSCTSRCSNSRTHWTITLVYFLTVFYGALTRSSPNKQLY